MDNLKTENTQLTHSIKKIKANGVRITPQREIILEYLITHHIHPSVKTIQAGISSKLPNLSTATIYNTIKMLVDNELVIELPNKDGGIRYDYFGVPHFHAICENCGKITDVFLDEYPQIAEELEKATRDKSGYLITGTKVEISGICPECQKKLHLDK